MKKIRAVGLIPTRLGSQRLPQKALLDINNLPLIIHTYRRAELSKLLDDDFKVSKSIFVFSYIIMFVVFV